MISELFHTWFSYVVVCGIDMSFERFNKELALHIPEARRVTDAMRLFALGTDASFYRLTPKLIVYAEHEQDIIIILQLAQRYRVPVTFRAAGTSLSGQAVTDSVLIMLTDAWQHHKIEPFGEVIHLQPGLIGAAANRLLKPFGQKIGPDPASLAACKVGGIVANNASGMCCGTAHNSYHTMAGIRVILADGSILDTRDADNIASFRQRHPSLLTELASIRAQLLSNTVLAEQVRHKYRLKNTTGYGLNAFLDFDDPIDILAHLMVGSEGTLGFISEVALRTVPDHPHRATLVLGFDQLAHCTVAVVELKQLPVDAVELLDTRAIRSVQHMPGLPSFALSLADTGGLLLIDVRAATVEQLASHCQQVQQLVECLHGVHSTGFTENSEQIEQYWKIRKGTFPAVGANRKPGTTVIIEDIAFPINDLAAGVSRLQQLFEQFAYTEAIIFGHALEGNLHFVFTQAFDSDAEIERYDGFMQAVATMVTQEFNGSLKAEHGTGRNMAPFVRLEWGDEGYGLMQRLKIAFDPLGVINPGVILNEDPKVHLKQLKSMPIADEKIDRCIECGFCEPICPSKQFTLTPRQRIAAFRELTRLQNNKQTVSRQWQKSFDFQAIDSCAATGLCAQPCPVDINTGELVLKLRARRNFKYRHIAKSLAKHFAALASSARAGLALASAVQWLVGPQRLQYWSLSVRKASNGRLPVWPATTPTKAKPVYARIRSAAPTDENTVVYWPSCVSQTMAGAIGDGRQQIPDAVRSVLAKAGLTVLFPQPTRGLCCGQPFASKGHNREANSMMNEVLDALWEVSGGGRYPVLSDTSPCALQLQQAAQQRGIQLYDSPAFIDRFLLNRLTIAPEQKPVAMHLTCSSQKQGGEASFKRVLDKITPNWSQPSDIHCCGFAGDKGFTLPELNASALCTLAVKTKDCAYGISTSRTCEIGLSQHSGLTYYSLFEVVDKLSAAKVG